MPVNRATLAAAGTAVVLAGLGLAWWLTRSSQPAAVPQYKLTQITRDTGYTANPALSPNGELLAYSSDRDGDGVLDLWVQQLTGGAAPINLTKHPDHDYWPSFSPDGSRIVFNSEREGGGIYVVPALGGSPVPIVAGIGLQEHAAHRAQFSPDGERISYSRRRLDSGAKVHSQVEIVPASGGAPSVVEIDLRFARGADLVARRRASAVRRERRLGGKWQEDARRLVAGARYRRRARAPRGPRTIRDARNHRNVWERSPITFPGSSSLATRWEPSGLLWGNCRVLRPISGRCESQLVKEEFLVSLGDSPREQERKTRPPPTTDVSHSSIHPWMWISGACRSTPIAPRGAANRRGSLAD